MKIFYLIIDESGAKGKAKNKENNLQEFGVMVGFLVPSEYIEIWRKRSEKIFKINMNEKIHIVSLSKEEQYKFRKILYEIFQQSGINWFYEAVYVQGFNEGAFDDKELLHSKLFSGVFMKALYNLALLNETGSIKIFVISDRLNKGEIKAFEKEVQDIIKIMTNQEIKKNLTFFNKEIKKVVKTTLVSKIIQKDKIFPKFEDIQLEIKTEISTLTFMADILANSVYYYLEDFLKGKQNYPKLNTKQAIQNHPLSKLVLGIIDENDENALPDIFDMMYRKRK